VLVVVRGTDHVRDLRALRPYIDDVQPILVGVDGGPMRSSQRAWLRMWSSATWTWRVRAFLGPVALGFWFTLRERAMLGDSGASLIGDDGICRSTRRPPAPGRSS
jgi:hypothetical protein